MSATTVDIDTQRKGFDNVAIGQHPVAASEKIPAGVMVARNTAGNAVNATDAASRMFAGFSDAMADNSSGSAADIDVRVFRRGIFEVAYSGTITIASIGADLYVSDNQTVILTSGSHALKCGKLFKMSTTSGKLWMEIDAAVDRNAATS